MHAQAEMGGDPDNSPLAGISFSCTKPATAPIKQPCVYILSSKLNGTLYVGVTSDLYGRMAEHKQSLIGGFTKKYAVTRLVYYEMRETMEDAIRREKRLKKWYRLWKLRIIEEVDPEWLDLFDESTGELRDLPGDQSHLRT